MQTQGGASIAQDFGPGVGADDALTQSWGFADYGDGTDAQAAPIAPTPQAVAPAKTSTIWYLFGVVLLLVAFKFAVEHEKSGMDFSFMGISVYNFIAAGTMSLLFIITMKIIVNKYYVPGLTDLVNVA